MAMTTMANFQVFLLDARPKMTSKYPFLSQDQILSRLRLEWKKNYETSTKKKSMKNIYKNQREDTTRNLQTCIGSGKDILQSRKDQNNGKTNELVPFNQKPKIPTYPEPESGIDTEGSQIQDVDSPYMKNKFLIDNLNSEFYMNKLEGDVDTDTDSFYTENQRSKKESGRQCSQPTITRTSRKSYPGTRQNSKENKARKKPVCKVTSGALTFDQKIEHRGQSSKQKLVSKQMRGKQKTRNTVEMSTADAFKQFNEEKSHAGGEKKEYETNESTQVDLFQWEEDYDEDAVLLHRTDMYDEEIPNDPADQEIRESMNLDMNDEQPTEISSASKKNERINRKGRKSEVSTDSQNQRTVMVEKTWQNQRGNRSYGCSEGDNHMSEREPAMTPRKQTKRTASSAFSDKKTPRRQTKRSVSPLFSDKKTPKRQTKRRVSPSFSDKKTLRRQTKRTVSTAFSDKKIQRKQTKHTVSTAFSDKKTPRRQTKRSVSPAFSDKKTPRKQTKRRVSPAFSEKKTEKNLPGNLSHMNLRQKKDYSKQSKVCSCCHDTPEKLPKCTISNKSRPGRSLHSQKNRQNKVHKESPKRPITNKSQSKYERNLPNNRRKGEHEYNHHKLHPQKLMNDFHGLHEQKKKNYQVHKKATHTSQLIKQGLNETGKDSVQASPLNSVWLLESQDDVTDLEDPLSPLTLGSVQSSSQLFMDATYGHRATHTKASRMKSLNRCQPTGGCSSVQDWIDQDFGEIHVDSDRGSQSPCWAYEQNSTHRNEDYYQSKSPLCTVVGQDTQLDSVPFGELFSDPPSSTGSIDAVTPHKTRKVLSGAHCGGNQHAWWYEEEEGDSIFL